MGKDVNKNTAVEWTLYSREMYEQKRLVFVDEKCVLEDKFVIIFFLEFW